MKLTPLNEHLIIAGVFWAAFITTMFLAKIRGAIDMSWWLVSAAIWAPVVVAVILAAIFLAILSQADIG